MWKSAPTVLGFLPARLAFSPTRGQTDVPIQWWVPQGVGQRYYMHGYASMVNKDRNNFSSEQRTTHYIHTNILYANLEAMSLIQR